MRKLIITILFLYQFLPILTGGTFFFGIQSANAQIMGGELDEVVIIGHNDNGNDDDDFGNIFDDDPSFEEIIGIGTDEVNEGEGGTNDGDNSSYYNEDSYNYEIVAIDKIEDKQRITGSIPLDSQVGNQNVLIDVNTHIILHKNIEGNIYMIEITALSTNTHIDCGNMIGAFGCQLIIDGKTIAEKSLVSQGAYIVPSGTNFAGSASFSNIGYIGTSSIEIRITGNWKVDTGNGFTMVTYPSLLGVFFPVLYKKGFKIK